jgi:hypothetical protein
MIQPPAKFGFISKETVATIPEFYARMESEAPTTVDRILPATLTGQRLLEMSEAKWLGWLLSIPISGLLAWLAALLFSLPTRIASKLRKPLSHRFGRHESAFLFNALLRS